MESAPPATTPANAAAGGGSSTRPWPVLLRVGRWMLGTLGTIRRIGAFTLITLATVATRYGASPRVIRPLVQRELVRAGVRVVPIICFLGGALGLTIVGQTVLLLVQVGQTKLIGPLLVTVIVRELGPMTAALVVLARVGTASVTELGMARAMGEVEALEALGIDPIHYLVVPRVIGFTVAIVALSVYAVLAALGAGYVVAFLRGLSMSPGGFLLVVADALMWMDFPLLALKTLLFGMLTAVIICYHGLADPLRLEEVGQATTKTVAHTLVACLCVDALFLPIYLLL